jgi:hypothetical protein
MPCPAAGPCGLHSLSHPPATAGPAAAPALQGPAAAFDPSKDIYALSHINVIVPNVTKEAAYYRRLLGWGRRA